MKLVEKRRLRRGDPKAVELITQPIELELKFDPRVDLKEEDWQAFIEHLRRNEMRDGLIHDTLQVWAHQKRLDPERFARMLQEESDVANFFHRLQRQDVERLVVRAQTIEIAMASRLAIRELFTSSSKLNNPEIDLIKRVLGNRASRVDVLELIRILSVAKQFPKAPIPPTTELTSSVWEKFKQRWKATYEEGHLQDAEPDKLAAALAQLRIVDPEKFSEIKLDKRFWDLALEWLRELRKDQITVDLFNYAHSLYILSADEVSLTQDGELHVSSKGEHPLRQTPKLPERNIVT